MKISFIVNRFPCISETFILNQIIALLDRGHDVTIFAHNTGRSSLFHPIVEQYRLLERTFYFKTPPGNYLKRLLEGFFIGVKGLLKEPASTFRALDYFRLGRHALSLRPLYLVEPFIGRGDFEAIHCHFGPNGLDGVLIKQLLKLNAKIVVTFHGFDINVLPIRYQENIYSELFKKVDAFTVNTEFLRSKALNLGCPQAKLVTIPAALDIKQFDYVEKCIPISGVVQLASVGRLTEVKGTEFAISAVAQLVNDGYKVKYNIIGDGHLRQKLQTQADSLGLLKNQSIIFHGELTADKVRSVLSKCHIYVHPSIIHEDGAEEAQGLAIQEAQALGLPVVATNTGGIPEGLIDGISGYLVPERDPESIAQKIQFLIENSELWPQIGLAGRAFVEDKYDITYYIEKIEALYRGIID
ncbi:MAG TPA: colanic acid biosynthesis glycosyltransferase WcaL [candidate division Zixibacteria bacterium]|nr:colanic acid biosynthesis glycosyltransferase WcaL [candidate division Zixibacteria bacterium]